MTFAEDGRTIGGSSPQEVAARLSGVGVAAIGANCSRRTAAAAAGRRGAGPSPGRAAWSRAGGLLHAQRRLARACRGRVIYPSSPSTSRLARRAAEAGVRIIGGCCGTTTAHGGDARPSMPGRRTRRWMTSRSTLTSPRRPSHAHPGRAGARSGPGRGPDPPAREAGSRRVRGQRRDRSAKGTQPDQGARRGLPVAGSGCRFHQRRRLADGPRADERPDYVLSHSAPHRVETILHFTTRDRSLMGLGSRSCWGRTRSVCATSSPSPATRPASATTPIPRAVYDVDSIGLIRILDRLNTGADSAGRRSGGRPRSPSPAPSIPRADLEHEAGRLRAKLEAGAHVVMTQPIYDPASWSVSGRPTASSGCRCPSWLASAAAKQQTRRVPPQRGAGHHPQR